MNIRGSVNMVRFCELTWNKKEERILLMVLITDNCESP